MATKKHPKKRNKAYRPKNVMAYVKPAEQLDYKIMSFFFTHKLAAGTFQDLDGQKLAYMLNVAHTVAVRFKNELMIKKIEAAMEAYIGIRQRKERTGRWGAAGQEFLVLKSCSPGIAEYMITHPIHHILQAQDYVDKCQKKLRERRLLSADVDEHGNLINEIPFTEAVA